MHATRRIVEGRSAKWVHPYTGAILDVPDSIEYALRLERETPTTWGSDGAASERCPECGGEFELGSAVQLFSFMQGEGFRCRACKVIFAHDLTVLARPMG
jgi:hypothetical protein